MATIQRFEELKVWQQARELAKIIRGFTRNGDFAKNFELKNQISRSSGSVMDNIAEGVGRGSRTEFIQFLGYSLGSNDEVKSQLYRALDREHITQPQFAELYAQADWVARMITSFMNYLKKSSYKGFKYNTSGVEEPFDYALTTNLKHQTLSFMKRRDSLKALSLTGFGLAVNPVEAAVPAPPDPKPLKIPGGRQKFEAERDAKLNAEKFFTPHELQTVTVLSDIIIPADAKSGSASQSGVPAFIEFMMKDQPRNQTPMRGGIRWLDNTSTKLFGKPFVQCTKAQQIELVDQIAYPAKVKPNLSQGASFFSLMRNMTATGFFTSQMGIKDLGYVGNVPNQWDGVPADVLKQYDLAYEERELNQDK